jgi:primosomal protein N' (replication factor Y)
MTRFAEVVFPLPLVQSFSYIVPDKSRDSARPGVRILAQLGGKTQSGFIVRVHEQSPRSDMALKEILEVIDTEPVISPLMLSLTRRLSEHFGSSWGAFLQAALPPLLEVRTASARVGLTDKGIQALGAGTLAKEEKRVAAVLGPGAYSVFYLRRKTGAKNIASVISRMVKKELIRVLEKKKAPKARIPSPARTKPAQLELDFSADPVVRGALDVLAKPLAAGEFSSYYLFGARDARRAVFIDLIRSAISRSKQVLFLLPELAPSVPLKDLLETRLGPVIAFFHGQMPGAARELAWRKIRSGAARVVIGPRSALFAPVDAAGLIIVDEEHDDAYFQSESPSFDARQGARLKAEDGGALVVYGSDTPSVEAFYRARAEGHLITLSGGGEKQNVAIADDRSERGLLTRRLQDGLGKSLRDGRPGLLFINRRGYASFLFCPRCGHIPRCDRCDISLTFYKKSERLVCRYCGDSEPRSAACPRCGSRVMEPRGAGVEAVVEELERLYPRARVASFDSDRVKTKSARERVLENFREGKIDVLVGTQLLAYRTTELPLVPWIGILNPEALLAFADFRASQKTFQSVRRMMRFAAPAAAGSEIVIQTAFPDHYSIREAAREDYPAFYEEEIRFRRLMNYPPFSAMAEIVLWGKDPRPLAEKARELSGRAKAHASGIEILGPALAPPSVHKGERGVQVILKSREKETLEACLAECLKGLRGKRTVVRYD